MSDKELKAKTAVFQAQFLKLFNAHTALLTGDSAESKKYQAYISRLGQILSNDSLNDDAREDLLIEEQEYSDMSYVAEDLAGDDQDLLDNLLETIARIERTVALVNIANNPSRKPRTRKARAEVAA